MSESLLQKDKDFIRSESEKIKSDFQKIKTESSQNNDIKPFTVDKRKVFANTEVHLKDISVFGFDYDYTIANYQTNTLQMSYTKAKDYLVNQMKYPKDILKLSYDNSFAIRGLHYDMKTGFLFKLNQFSKIEIGSVFYGKTQIPQKTVEEIYPGRRVGDDYAEQNLKMMSDLFEVPVANLIADIISHFDNHKIDFDTRYLYEDIHLAFVTIHKNKTVHKTISKDMNSYLKPSKKLISFIKQLLVKGKKIFMLTNNSYKYVDIGCSNIFKEIVGDKSFGFNHWYEIFDVVMMLAFKPSWYDSDDTFRIWDIQTETLSFKSVNSFERGKIYYGGSFAEFTRITNYPMAEVLYMGDNIYNDLRHPRKFCQWRTVAIIKELDREIDLMNGELFNNICMTLQKTENIFKRIRNLKSRNNGKNVTELIDVVKDVKRVIDKCNVEKKSIFNRHFGSIFRTRNSASKFFYNAQRYADLYTSSVDNFAECPLDSAFYVKPRSFSHEVDFAIKCIKK